MVPFEQVKAWPAAALSALLCWCCACAPRSMPPASSPTSAADDTPSIPASSAVPTTSATGEAALDDSGGSEADNDGAGDETEPSDGLLPQAGNALPHPLDGWSDERIERAVSSDLASLGPMSVGTPNAGALVNGVQAVASPLYTLVSPSQAWGTQETIDYLNTAVQAVHDQFPDTPPLALGDIAARHGGPLRPHISHQAGRDLDISFYYRDGTKWYARGTRENLDFPRLWALVRALIAKTDIELILLDHGLQQPLKEYALSIGEDPIWVAQVFQGQGAVRAVFYHAPGHDTHLHLRFFNPIAQETARRCYAALARQHIVKVPEQYLSHKAKKNETLAMIAKKYGSSVRAIRDANGLRSNLIHEQAVYRIPISGVRVPHLERARIPARRPPPPLREPGASGNPLSTREQKEPARAMRQLQLQAAARVLGPVE